MASIPSAQPPTLIVAHRALTTGVPENSLAGIRLAAQAGADLVEIDVRRSLDGIPYLLHDRTLARTTTGMGPIRLLPSRYLNRVQLRSGDESLPTLSSALDALPNGTGAALHLKDQGSLRSALRVVQCAGLEDTTWLWLHGTTSVRLARSLAPAARVTLLEAGAKTLADWERHLDSACHAGATGVSIPWDDLSPALLGAIHLRGLRSFSLNHDPDAIPGMIRDGLTGIITDNPAMTRRVVRQVAPAGMS